LLAKIMSCAVVRLLDAAVRETQGVVRERFWCLLREFLSHRDELQCDGEQVKDLADGGNLQLLAR
jgi:hypothetical protein